MLFEKIMKVHDEKYITRLCKKLSKSCSFTKNSDVTSLCELAYWLYGMQEIHQEKYNPSSEQEWKRVKEYHQAFHTAIIETLRTNRSYLSIKRVQRS